MLKTFLFIVLIYCSIPQLNAQILPPKSTNPFRDYWDTYFLEGGGPGTNTLPFDEPHYNDAKIRVQSYINDYEYLISSNGKYKFQNVIDSTEVGVKQIRHWAIINTETGGHVYDTKKYPSFRSMFNDRIEYWSPPLFIMPATPFTSLPCEAPQQNKNCQAYSYEGGGEFRLPTQVGVPILMVHSIKISDMPYFLAGIPSAFQYYADRTCRDTGYRVPMWRDSLDINGPNVSKVLIPTTNEVYVKEASTGVYSVPQGKQVFALKILDDGNLVMINKNNKVLWESATGEQQLVDTRFNKKFTDIKVGFKQGLGLIAQGNVELINTKITQKNAGVTLMANSYVQMLPGAENSSLQVKGSKGFVLLKSIGIAASNPASNSISSSKSAASKVSGDAVSKEKPVSTFITYPNPTTGLVNFATGNSEEKILYINIIDIEGRIIERFADTDKVDLSENPTGIYFYKVVTSIGMTRTGKIIKK